MITTIFNLGKLSSEEKLIIVVELIRAEADFIYLGNVIYVTHTTDHPIISGLVERFPDYIMHESSK